jgi:hypothetical protein
MTPADDKLSTALQAMAAGNVDALTPQEVARLEAFLNRQPRAAESVADVVLKPDPRLTAGLTALEQRALPSAAQWEDVWKRIDEALPASAAGRPAAKRARPLTATRIFRHWQPLLAAAACLLLALVWLWERPKPSDFWPMQLATNVQIDDLEVGEDATPFVINSDGVDVIWVLEGQT